MNMNVNSTDNTDSQYAAKRDNDFLDLLAIFLIGGIGVFLSLLEVDDPVSYVLKLGALLVIIGCGVVKFISMVWDLRDRSKKSKEQTKNPSMVWDLRDRSKKSKEQTKDPN